MARDFDPYRLASPQVYLWRMVVFLVIAAFVTLILYRQVYVSFLANPALNSVIIAVLFIGILLAFRQVIRIFREVRWVNNFRTSDRSMELERPPVLLAPMAAILGDRIGRVSISTQTMRSVLDSILMRLDEDRDTSRYLTGLLIFLGLLGTFWGLLETVGAVADAIGALNVGSGDSAVIFEDLKAGLQAPLKGMGTAFSSSLFGLSGSLILGFLDLQAGRAQTRFYTELENWLSTVTDLADGAKDGATEELKALASRLRTAQESGGGNNQRTAAAMASLAEGISGLVKSMRNEQQMMRDWMEAQAEDQKALRKTLDNISVSLKKTDLH